MRSWKTPGPLGASLAIALALTTLADEARAQSREEPGPSRQRRSRDILAQIDRPQPEPGWFETHVSFQGKGGLVYSDSFQVGDRAFGFTLRGPVQRKVGGGKAFGLSCEIRF